MDIDKIQALIKFVSKQGVSEVELETEEFKITIKSDKIAKAAEPQIIQAQMPMMQPMAAPMAAPAPVAAAPAPAPAAIPAASKEADENSKYITVKSPMIGTFYRSAGPGKPEFISIGDKIQEGSVTCIIEAMKLFNEIESEISGKIIKVLVDDATPVEYDQPLFLVDPS